METEQIRMKLMKRAFFSARIDGKHFLRNMRNAIAKQIGGAK